VHSRASGRLSAHSQATDPVIDLINKMFDKVADDAVAQRADAATLRADADRRKQQMQARMEAEMSRREREVAEKTHLQMELAQLKRDIAAEKRQTTAQLLPPAITRQERPESVGERDGRAEFVRAAELMSDSHAQLPPPTVDSMNPATAGTNVTATARDAYVLSLPAPAPADTQRATLPAPDSLT